VEIATRMACPAEPAEILVSRTVEDLVIGSGIALTERGTHALAEGSEPWPVHAVSERPAS
jgi:class 3 adenylate cyclase